DFQQASTFQIAAVTAWSSLVTEGNISSGQTVLTLGTGGVSIFALQFAKATGAKVIITSSSDEKLDRARQLGADYTINYQENPEWYSKVLEFTDGHGVDITIDTGGANTLEKSIKSTKTEGIVAVL
ncbi:MAG: zinc-binding dehydrogenase, partial [Candidatus Anammoxibacter sp.]